MTNEQRKPSDVVSVAGLREILDSGWQLHVVCSAAPEMRGYQYHGSWYLVAVDPKTEEWVVLVTARDQARERHRAKQGRVSPRSPEDVYYREIKTASGLITLLREFGIKTVGIPTEAGTSVVLLRDA